MAWRLGPTQTPRLQAGDAPSLPSAYAAPRASSASTGTSTGRYGGHADPSRCVEGGGGSIAKRADDWCLCLAFN